MMLYKEEEINIKGGFIINKYAYILTSIKNNDEDLKVFIKELLDLDRIENKTAAVGIAKQFVVEGSCKMTPVQIDSLAKYGVLPHYNECPICGVADWDVMDFINYEGTCPSCDNLQAE